jgi:hypothetical protein
LGTLVDGAKRCELQIDQRGAMAARAVHQHQRVVGREIAQGDRADEGGAVRDRKALRIQRRRYLGQAIRQVERRLVRE